MSDRDGKDRRRRNEPVVEERRRAPHRDHSRAPETLDDTLDADTGRLPDVRGLLRDAVPEAIDPDVTPSMAAAMINDAAYDAATRIERAVRGEAIDRATSTAELEMLPGTAWAREVDASIAGLKAAVNAPPRWRRLRIVGTWLTGGALLGALGLAIRALIAYGTGQESGRVQSDAVKRHEQEIRDLQNRQAADDEAHGRRQRP